ncbi:MAG: choice-of-anchor Q domain-containing protein, partial [Solirubrobacterales bacterium]
MPKRFFLIAALAAAALTLPATAQAADICVGTTPIVCPSEDFPASAAGFASAVSASEGSAGPDRILLEATTFVLPTPAGLNLNFTQPVEIIGAGVGQTVFDWGGDSTGLALSFDDATSYMSGFSVDFDGLGSSQRAVSVNTGVIRDFEVTDSSVASADSEIGVRLGLGGTAKDFKVTVNAGNIGVAFVGAGSIEGAQLLSSGLGALAINVATNAPVEVKRTKIRGFFEGIDMGIGEISVADTSIDIGSETGARGMDLLNSNNAVSTNPIVANLDRITVFGTGPNQHGLRVGADTATHETFDGTIEDSIIDISGTNASSIRCVKAYGQNATLSVVNTAFDVARFSDGTTPDEDCAETFTGTVDITSTIPNYVDAPSGDLRPSPGSPIIDLGSAVSLPGSAIDAAGLPRVVDGDGDCVAKLDLGAYEFQLPTPQSCLPPPYVPPAPPPVPLPLPVVPVTPSATAKLTTRARKAFRRSRSGFRKRTDPRATSFGITYRNAQIARFELQKAGRGRKKGSRCVRGSRGKRCTYYKKLRGIQRQDVYDGEIFYQFGG